MRLKYGLSAIVGAYLLYNIVTKGLTLINGFVFLLFIASLLGEYARNCRVESCRQRVKKDGCAERWREDIRRELSDERREEIRRKAKEKHEMELKNKQKELEEQQVVNEAKTNEIVEKEAVVEQTVEKEAE